MQITNQTTSKDYRYTGTSPKGLDPHLTVWIQFYWNYRMMDGLLYVVVCCRDSQGGHGDVCVTG